MNTDQSIRLFRDLHEAARRGNVSLEYRVMSDALLRSVTETQNSTLTPHQKRRQTPRVRRALQVDLGWATGRVRTTTFDLGLGGFSALLSSSPPDDRAVRFDLRLPGNRFATGTARPVGTRTRHRAVHASFTFQHVDEGGPLRAYLVDELLAEFCPETRRTIAGDDWFEELAGRARVATRP